MTPNPLNNAGVFLVSTLFDLAIFVLLIRIILIMLHADYYNPISQIIIRLTKPVIEPLRRFIPNFHRVELASVLLIFSFEMIKFLLLGLLISGLPNLFGLAILSIADALKSLVNIFFYAIIIQAIMSWVNSGYSPVAQILYKMTAPIIRPFQRIIPPVGGIDISPIPAMISLQLLLILLVSPLFAVGWGLAFG